MEPKTLCLLNDSFPPIIDGVANVVMNYASVLSGSEYSPVVITPEHPEADDSALPYPVIRYAAMDMRGKTGYMAGIPFSAEVAKSLEGKPVELIHSHCPIVSTMIGRELRAIKDAPLVLTYHTKFDVDIANLIKSPLIQETAKRALVENINACDEVWAVSRGAIDNLRSLGYQGECLVMDNGVDLSRGKATPEKIQEVTGKYDLPQGIPVYLFVGRMMWYKGLRITLDALAKLKQSGEKFRMVFVGGGGDFQQVQAYCAQLGLDDVCFFVGPERDRENLRAWYSRADLFLFPSTFDTNGLVVREAAACSLGAVLIEGSCAAEGVTDGRNGMLIAENAGSMYACLKNLGGDLAKMETIGENACKELYLSWQDAVQIAKERYQVVIDRYRSGKSAAVRKTGEELFRSSGEMMETLGKIQLALDGLHTQQRERIELFHDRVSQRKENIQEKLTQQIERISDEIRDKFE